MVPKVRTLVGPQAFTENLKSCWCSEQMKAGGPEGAQLEPAS